MAEIAEVKTELNTAARELGNGYVAAGEARKKVRECVEMQARNVELLGGIIASIVTTGEQLAKARADSERSQEFIGKATLRIGTLGLRSINKENVSSLPGVVTVVSGHQEVYTDDMESQAKIADDFVGGFRNLHEELKDWCGVLAQSSRDDAPEHLALSEAVSQTSASVYEI